MRSRNHWTWFNMETLVVPVTNIDSLIAHVVPSLLPVPQLNINSILRWNCRGPRLKKDQLVLKLRNRSIPILTFCKGSLPGGEIISGYVKYCNPSLPTFPHDSTALYIWRDLPQHKLDTSSLRVRGCECVAVELRLGGSSLTVACLYIHPVMSHRATRI